MESNINYDMQYLSLFFILDVLIVSFDVFIISNLSNVFVNLILGGGRGIGSVTSVRIWYFFSAYHGHLTSLIDISHYKFNLPGGPSKKDHVHVVSCTFFLY